MAVGWRSIDSQEQTEYEPGLLNTYIFRPSCRAEIAEQICSPGLFKP